MKDKNVCEKDPVPKIPYLETFEAACDANSIQESCGFDFYTLQNRACRVCDLSWVTYSTETSRPRNDVL